MNATQEKRIEMAYSKESHNPVTRSDCEPREVESRFQVPGQVSLDAYPL